LLVNLLTPHPEAPTRPSTPKVLRARERAPITSPFVVITFGLVVESIQELGGVPKVYVQVYKAFEEESCYPK